MGIHGIGCLLFLSPCVACSREALYDYLGSTDLHMAALHCVDCGPSYANWHGAKLLQSGLCIGIDLQKVFRSERVKIGHLAV
jgi:hypothetical protein